MLDKRPDIAVVHSSRFDSVEIDNQGRPISPEEYDEEDDLPIRFDLWEYEEYYGEYADSFDILDLAYWDSEGYYFLPEDTYRWVPLLQRILRANQPIRLGSWVITVRQAMSLMSKYEAAEPEEQERMKRTVLTELLP